MDAYPTPEQVEAAQRNDDAEQLMSGIEHRAQGGDAGALTHSDGIFLLSRLRAAEELQDPAGWKQWHRTLSHLLDVRFNERDATLDVARVLKKQNEKLQAACETFVLWMDREDGKVDRPPEGWGEIRKTPEGERRWRQWYDENIRICDLACTKAREALGVI